MLKKLWSSLPQISLMIIILALLKNFLYYFNFGVPIKYFIGLSELGLLVADDLFILVPVVFIIYLITSESGETKSKRTNITEEKGIKSLPIERKKGKIRKVLDLVMPYVVAGIFISALGIGPFIIIFKAPSFSDKLLGFLFLAAAIFFLLFIFRHEKLETLITSDGMSLSLFLMMFFILFIIRTSGEISSVEKGEYVGTKIVTSDSTYTSTDSTYYIGQTSNYVFFYNKKDNHTTIIPSSEVKKLELYRR